MFGTFANSRLALIFRRWRGRFGIFAPRVAVRTHVPAHWWGVAAAVILIVSVVIAHWVFDAGRRFAGFDVSATGHEIDNLRSKATELEKEVARLRGLADAGESRLQIELAAQQQLARQVKQLEEENAQLKDDLSAFETLAQAGGQEANLSINRLRVEQDGGNAGQYRYHMLVSMNGNGKEREFKGHLQLALKLQQQGHDVMMTFPSAADAASQQYRISFKHFRRIDGSFPVPANVKVRSVEVRLLQDGTLKASKTVNF